MAKKVYFRPALFKFLKDLAANNNREWFNAHKDEYIATVREPVQDFINDFEGPLKKLNPHFVADPRPHGGSMFRIYRDTRFSRDKSPYKTHVGVLFRHRDADAASDPGLYFHLAPGRIFIGAGTWKTDRDSLDRIRTRIARRPKEWEAVKRARGLGTRWEFGGSSLVRAPKGYDADHPCIEDLKRKDFFVVHRGFTQVQACSNDYMARVVRAYRATLPLVEFLCRAKGLRW